VRSAAETPASPPAPDTAPSETTGRPATPGGTAGSLEPLQSLVAEDLKRVNDIIVEKMHSPVALIPQLAGHIVAAGGKRLRPMLTLASARLCGAEEQREFALAACVEFIHTATLLHDDVVDDSHLRRGLQTANAVWGNKASVLVGDFLFSRAFQLMVTDGSLVVLKVLSDASATIAEGEVHQLLTANDLATDEQAYLEVIEAKTAALFAAACEIGAVVAHRSETEQAALRRFGLNFGNAFQLVDDILDYSAEQQALGKTIGDDFREGKITLPLVLAYARGDEEERSFWRRCVEELEQGEGDLQHAIALMERHGALEESKQRARSYAARAVDDLSGFPDNPAKHALVQAIDFCVDRLY
jgi:octaprenyl-diphosphate synthase